jgi:hypothetical protein
MPERQIYRDSFFPPGERGLLSISFTRVTEFFFPEME